MRYEDIRNHVQKMLQAELARRLQELKDHGPEQFRATPASDNTRMMLAEGSESYWETIGPDGQDHQLKKFATECGLSFESIHTERAKILPLIHRGLLAMLAEFDTRKAQFETIDLTETTQAVSDSNVQTPKLEHGGKTLAEVVELYINEQVRVGGWLERTRKKQVATLGVLVELVGSNTPMMALTKTHAQDVKSVLLTLPARKNTMPTTKGLSLREAAKLTGLETLNPTTLNGYLGIFHTFTEWAANNAYGTNKPFDGMKVRAKRTAAVVDQVRTAFPPEAVALMVSELTRPDSQLVKKESYRWASLIGIFSGARLSEVCSLRSSDIQQHDGIWCFSINNDDPEGRKNLKTPAARRLVPIHSMLIKHEILDFVARQSKYKEDARLFPDFPYSATNGYTKNQGRWFNTVFLKGLGLKTEHAVFHALRHTMITRLHQSNVPQPLVQTIIGHEREGVTMKTYFNEGYSVEQLKAAIEGFLVPNA